MLPLILLKDADEQFCRSDPPARWWSENVEAVVLTLLEAAFSLALRPQLAADYQSAVGRLLQFGEPADWSKAREDLMNTSFAIVGHGNPSRFPWFALGGQIGRWRFEHDELLDLPEEAESAPAAGRTGPSRTPPGGYTPPPFAPIYTAAAAIHPDEARGIAPIRHLVTAGRELEREQGVRKVLREYAPAAAFDLEPRVLDASAVTGFALAVMRALHDLVCGHPSPPSWNRERRTLSHQGRVVRTYATQASTAMAVLDQFERMNWPVAVVLPKCDQHKVKDAVDSLNKALTGIRFHADGGSTGIRWEPTTS